MYKHIYLWKYIQADTVVQEYTLAWSLPKFTKVSIKKWFRGKKKKQKQTFGAYCMLYLLLEVHSVH